MKKIYLVYAREIGAGEIFVFKAFTLRENAEDFVENWKNDKYIMWTQEIKLEDSL